MNKEEYLSRLRDLTSSLPVEDQMDALYFYQTYFEDAGEGKEQDVISELGSPEEVAKKILAEQGISSTEDSTASANSTTEDSTVYSETCESTDTHNSTGAKQNQTNGKVHGFFANCKNKLDNWEYYQTHKSGCIILLIIAAIFTIPLWGGIFGGIFGLVAGIVGVLIGLYAAVFALSISCLIGGVACVIAGFAVLIPSLGVGLFVIGIGLLLLALSSLGWALFGQLCFRFAPWLVRSFIGLFRKSTPTVGGASA